MAMLKNQLVTNNEKKKLGIYHLTPEWNSKCRG